MWRVALTHRSLSLRILASEASSRFSLTISHVTVMNILIKYSFRRRIAARSQFYSQKKANGMGKKIISGPKHFCSRLFSLMKRYFVLQTILLACLFRKNPQKISSSFRSRLQKNKLSRTCMGAMGNRAQALLRFLQGNFNAVEYQN